MNQPLFPTEIIRTRGGDRQQITIPLPNYNSSVNALQYGIVELHRPSKKPD
jgi:hypothetical protein